YDVPVDETPATGAPMFEVPVSETPADSFDARPVESFGSFTPSVPTWTPAPTWVASAASMWGPPSMSATLWGDPITPSRMATPIWAEVAAAESAQAKGTSLFE